MSFSICRSLVSFESDYDIGFMYFSSDALSPRVSPPPKVWRNSCNTPVTLVALNCPIFLYNLKNRNSESSTRRVIEYWQYKDTVISQTRT